MKHVNVKVKDDCFMEEVEKLDLLLVKPTYVDQRIQISTEYGQMRIIDDDSMFESQS